VWGNSGREDLSRNWASETRGKTPLVMLASVSEDKDGAAGSHGTYNFYGDANLKTVTTECQDFDVKEYVGLRRLQFNVPTDDCVSSYQKRHYRSVLLSVRRSPPVTARRRQV